MGVRQLLSIRFVAAVAALALLAFGVNSVFSDEDDVIEAVVEATTPPERRIDVIELVESFERSADFEIAANGRTIGFLDMVIDEQRALRVVPGTPGVIECGNLRNTRRCVVFADTLGEAVVWFAVLPRGPRDTVILPPITDLNDGYAIFENGWQIQYPPIIRRNCGDELDIRSFSDFLRRFGPESTSIVDLDTRLVTEVTCADDAVAVTTTVVTADEETNEATNGETDGATDEEVEGEVPAPETTAPLFVEN